MRLIDADALIDEIKHTLWDWDSVDGIKSSTVLKQTISDINNMPTIDAEPIKHGKWIYKEYEPSKVEYYECSECGYVTFNEKVCHYCYNCGARMDEVEE